MTEKEKLEKWSKDALSHTDWNNRPLAQEEVVTKEIKSFPKDANGETIIPDNISEDRLTVGKPVFKRVNQISPFENTQVINAFTGF